MKAERPHLSIKYSPDLDLSLQLAKAFRYKGGWFEHFFEVRCTIKHPSGQFTYFVERLYLQPADFSRFAEELHGIQQGTSKQASLKSVGDMLVLQLDLISHRLQLSLTVREYMPPKGVTTLGLVTDVDYDLFINKLLYDLSEFIQELGEIEAENMV